MKWRRGLFNFLLLPLLAAAGAFAQAESSDYQDRGDRFEGRRRHPVGGNEIELLGAMIDGPDRLSSLPAELALSFYLRDGADPQIIVRERNPQKEYWLDQVRPSKRWLFRSVNRFSWPTVPAMKELRLDPANLLALVRLGYSGPRVSEVVAPAQLATAESDFSVSGYRFTFRTSRPASVEVRLRNCAGEVEPKKLESPRRIPFDVRVSLTGAAVGSCRLELEGTMLDDAARIAQSVEFFGAPAGAGK